MNHHYSCSSIKSSSISATSISATNFYGNIVGNITGNLTGLASSATYAVSADYLDGQHGSYYAPVTNPTFIGTVTTPNISGTTFASRVRVSTKTNPIVKPCGTCFKPPIA